MFLKAEEQSSGEDFGNSLNAGDIGIFPVRESVNAKITSHTLTKENLIYATDVITTSSQSEPTHSD